MIIMEKSQMLVLPALLGCLSAAGGGLEIARDGSFRRDGVPVYLIGNIIYGAPHAEEYAPFPVNVPGWEWLYERPPTRAQFDRLGFNATGGEVSTTWMRKYRPEKWFWQGNFSLDWKDVALGYYLCDLPVFVDFTCAGWSHGGLKWDPKRPPSKEAFSEGSCHFMPYSVVTEEGFALYREMWQSGARELLAHGVRPFVYELFNEPTYHDTSPAAEAAFAKELKSLPASAPAVASRVERIKFDERQFARAMARGKAALREVDSSARTCFQPLGISFGFVNPLLANETTDVVMAPTGGGDPFDALVCLSIAGTRPVVDGEAYLGGTRTSHRATILRQYARGLNATYYFKWGRRARRHPEWKSADGPRHLAEQLPYECLNPAACPPGAFAGMKDAAKDIEAVNDLFTPRFRGVKQTVALLVSQATARLDRAAKHPNATYTRETALALLAARLPVKVVFEEQLDVKHLANVKLLVAAGIDATLPKTNARLERWVSEGGALLTVENTLNLTEWGEPEKTAFVTGHSGTLGKGRLLHLTKRPPSHKAAAVYRAVAERLGVRPSCRIMDARTGEELPGIECAAAQRVAAGGKKNARKSGFILINNDLLPYAVRLRPDAVGANVANWMDVTTGRRVPCTDEGDLLLRLLPNQPVVLRSVHAGEMPDEAETPETFFAGLSDWLAANRPDVSTDAFCVDLANVTCVDLRRVANGALEDAFGQLPWGRQVREGIPFEIIRIDQNDGRSGVFLDKGPVTIPVRGAFVHALAFLFAAPDRADGQLFTSRLDYADGTSEELVFSAPEDTQLVGWSNLAGRSLLLARQRNPNPCQELVSIQIATRRKGVALAALSLEKPDENPYSASFLPTDLKLAPWGGLKLVPQEDRLELRVSEATTDWAGFYAGFRTPIPLAIGDVAGRSLVLEVNLGDTPTGRAMQSASLPQFALGYKLADGTSEQGAYVSTRGGMVDTDPQTWQVVRIPLRRLVKPDATELSSFCVQLRPFGSQRAGMLLRGVRIE